MRSWGVVWLANVTGLDGSDRPAFCRIGDASAYREDDEFVIGWQDEIEAESAAEVCELMWMRHNADDRPSGRTCRSMCLGDVVVVGEVAYACEAMGFRQLDVGPCHVLPGTYVECSEGCR